MAKTKNISIRKKIDRFGNVRYYNEQNQLHRVDGPAIESANGYKEWWQNGKLHRDDGPAAEWANGDKVWYQNGKLHRVDGPAVEYANGYKEWRYIDKLIGSSPNDYTQEKFEQWLKLKAFQ